MGSKRRQEEDRGMRVSPDNFIVAGADGFARTRRPHDGVKQPYRRRPAGVKGSHRDFKETHGTGESRGEPRGGGRRVRERIEARVRQSATAVGPTHSSDEAVEVGARRHGGAKGLARQGTRGSDR